MNNPIEAKVARVLNSREVVINAGTEKGVTVGMLFDILNPNGEDIRDPESNEIIGSIKRPKVRVRVTLTQEKLSVASTFKKKTMNIGGNAYFYKDFGLISKSLIPPNYITKFETFKSDEAAWEDINEDDSYVKTGDPVIQVTQDCSDEE